MITSMTITFVENDRTKVVNYNFDEINSNPQHSDRLKGICEFAKNKKIHFPQKVLKNSKQFNMEFENEKLRKAFINKEIGR